MTKATLTPRQLYRLIARWNKLAARYPAAFAKYDGNAEELCQAMKAMEGRYGR